MTKYLTGTKQSCDLCLLGVQAGPGPQEVQEGEGEVVDPLQAQSLPTHWHPFFLEGKGIHTSFRCTIHARIALVRFKS